MIKNSEGFYQFQIFTKFPEVVHGISSKQFGDTKFDRNYQVNKNFEKILEKLNSQFKYALFQQVHKSKIAIITNPTEQKVWEEVDGGVTNFPNLFLGVLVADCYPILAFDPISKITGAAHAGWKGIKAGIVKNLILKMNSLGASSEVILIGIGPGICHKHYEVKDDVASKFGKEFLARSNNKIFLNLEKAIILQLTSSGIKTENIETANACTFENEDFFSARRDKTQERFTALIGLK